MSFTTFSRHRHFGHSFSKPLLDNSIISQAECPPSPPLPQTTLSQPRFSVFGKKKFNIVSPVNDNTIKTSSSTTTNIPEETSSPTTAAATAAATKITHHNNNNDNNQQQQQQQQPRRLIKKFEHLTQAKSTNVLAANEQEEKERQRLLQIAKEQEQEKLMNPDYYYQHAIKKEQQQQQQKKKKSVHFDPFFLETVCLFTQEQEPNQLQKKKRKQPALRLICPYWPTIRKDDMMIVNKKWFSVMNDFTIKGKILVRNLALDKSVTVRYTLDAWKTVSDADGWFFGPYPKNPAFDVYEIDFVLCLPDHGEMRGKLEFAIRLTANGVDYWDNNDDQNFHIRIIADPLNDAHVETEDEEEEEKYYRDDDKEDAFEKHSSFTNALKGYQHARPAHLAKRQQPWLGTRYDFSHSLSIEKRRRGSTNSVVVDTSDEEAEDEEEEDNGFFIKPHPLNVPPHSLPSDFLLTPSSSSESREVKPIFIDHSAPPSPLMSPTIKHVDVDSTYYLDLLNKYCFYNGDSPQQNSPIKK